MNTGKIRPKLDRGKGYYGELMRLSGFISKLGVLGAYNKTVLATKLASRATKENKSANQQLRMMRWVEENFPNHMTVVAYADMLGAPMADHYTKAPQDEVADAGLLSIANAHDKFGSIPEGQPYIVADTALGDPPYRLIPVEGLDLDNIIPRQHSIGGLFVLAWLDDPQAYYGALPDSTIVVWK